MKYKLYYIKPIKVQDKEIDIVVCAKCAHEARQMLKQHFMDEVCNHFKCVPQFMNRVFYDARLLDKAEIFEVNDYTDIPEKWEGCIPWGLPDEYTDFTCWAFVNQMESEKIYQPLIGKKIVRMYQLYNSINIELDDGSKIYFDPDEDSGIDIKEKS